MMASRLADAGEQVGKKESNCRQASRKAIAGRLAGRQLQASRGWQAAGNAGNCGAGWRASDADMFFS